MRVQLIGHAEDFDADVEQSLTDLGADWQISIATDATVALLQAQQQTPDVVVCELHPIGMDGTALLERIRSHAPQAMRIMLLGEDEGAQAMKALSGAHRLLNKPLRAEELLEAVESIADLRELLNSEVLKTALARLEKLPPPPKLYLALTKALNDPDTSLAQLAALVAQDPAMAAKVLRVCNSAFFAGGRTISDVRSAVIRLGQQELRRMVLSTEVFRDLGGGVDREAMRQRSMLAAQLAGRIIGSASAEMASTAALLAEVGMLLPGVAIPDRDGVLVGDGPHYAEAGAYLLGMWGLPMPIVEAVANHHQPRRARARGFWIGGAVHVAQALAAGQPVDEGYLASVGVLDRLPAWRQLADELRGENPAASTPDSPGAGSAPRQNEELRHANALLQRQAITEVELGAVHLSLLGSGLLAPVSAEVVDAALFVQSYDAVAVELCERRLQSRSLGTPPAFSAAPNILFGGAAAALRLAHSLRWTLAQRLHQQFKHWAEQDWHDAVDAAEHRRIAVWPIDRDIDASLARAVEGVGALDRLRVLMKLLKPGAAKQAFDGEALERLGQGDFLTCALREAWPWAESITRALIVERDRQMATALRERLRRSGAKRVLVVVGLAHVAGLKRALREQRE